VEGLVIPLDIAQVAGGTHDIVPGGAFGFQQAGDVLVSAAQLSPEVADMDAASLLVDARCPGDQQDGETVQVDPHAAYKGARLGVIVGLIEQPRVGDGAFFHRQCRQVLEQLAVQDHILNNTRRAPKVAVKLDSYT